MFYKIVNKVKPEDSRAIIYDLYKNATLIGEAWEADKLRNFINKEIKDTDKVECILIDGKKSNFDTKAIKEQANLGFEEYHRRYPDV